MKHIQKDLAHTKHLHESSKTTTTTTTTTTNTTTCICYMYSDALTPTEFEKPFVLFCLGV